MAVRAKTLEIEELSSLVRYIHERSRFPLRDTVIVLLSFKGGLRACEIAGLNWRDVCGVRGDKIGHTNEHNVLGFTVTAASAKNNLTRFVPLHPALEAALTAHLAETKKAAWAAHGPKAALSSVTGSAPVVRTLTGERFTRNNLQRYIGRLGDRCGLDITSHSGRRTFITRAVRVANKFDCSLKDVQRIVGHQDMSTTEVYIEPSEHVGKLVGAL